MRILDVDRGVEPLSFDVGRIDFIALNNVIHAPSSDLTRFKL